VERRYLLDASALIALIRNEPGAERVKEVLDSSQIHALNLAEVVRKMISKRMPPAEVRNLLEDLHLTVVEQLGLEQAYAAGQLAAERRDLGLSLGDAVCLTAAKAMDMTAITADRSWSGLGEVQVLMVR